MPVCPQCFETCDRKNGKTRQGKQRYLCSSCNVSFVENPQNAHRIRENIIPENRECCNLNLWAYGKNNQGIQRYYCRKCRKVYLTD